MNLIKCDNYVINLDNVKRIKITTDVNDNKVLIIESIYDIVDEHNEIDESLHIYGDKAKALEEYLIGKVLIDFD